MPSFVFDPTSLRAVRFAHWSAIQRTKEVPQARTARRHDGTTAWRHDPQSRGLKFNSRCGSVCDCAGISYGHVACVEHNFPQFSIVFSADCFEAFAQILSEIFILFWGVTTLFN